jgi:TonB-dependent receptor
MSIGTPCNRGKLACPFVLTLFTLLLHQSLFAQGSGSIRGRVFDKETGNALFGANVVVENTSLGASTDLDGRFNVRGVPAGKQTLRVSYIGYVAVTLEMNVTADSVLEQDFGLQARAITGQTVVVTAQALGQDAAIAQQLASNTIANVVSSARIKELPDVNAAESIGRLPGVAINRSNGEASTVVIRGLSAKYNEVTVNGVPLPATGADDRSVDLSLISSNLLDGIEIKKANTPDMEASALGGTVDLRLREAPDEPQVSASAQGGYNQLQKYSSNYNFMGSVSHRYFDGNLGVIAGLNADRYNRGADKFQGDYIVRPGPPITVGINDVQLRDEKVIRERAGGNLLLDYRVPYGKLTANGFYNQLISDNIFRDNQPDREHGSHYYTFQQNKPKTKIFTGAIGAAQDFDWIKYDLTIARTGTRTDDPDRRTWGFAQENAAFPNAPIATPPFDLPALETVDSNKTGLQSAYIYSTITQEYQNTAQLNLQIPVRISDQLSGYVKFGGVFRQLNRMNDQTQWGRDGLQYGQTSVNAPLTAAFQRLAQLYPDEFNWPQDSALARQYGQMPITRFLDRGYSRTDFLGGRWPQGMVANFDLLNKFTDALSSTSEWKQYGYTSDAGGGGSYGRDYSGVERYKAAYVMTELNLTRFATLLPGIRYEDYYSLYHGEVLRDNKVSNVEQAPVDFKYLSAERKNQFSLPMVHLILKPADWMRIRLARTETLTQPDYIMYAPITVMNSNNNYCRAANSLLKPAHSKNWDAAVSVYDKYVGLFSVSGFYKDIYDLILQSTIYYQQPQGSDDPGYPLPDGLNIPTSWLQGNSFQIDTYTNNPAVAIYKGVELEWQTHFWYLPSILQGLVLNVNFTRIYSQTYKELFFVLPDYSKPIPGHRPPLFQKYILDSSRVARMPDQPAYTANLTIGYDYKGFSARLIFLYQSDRTSFIAIDKALDTYIGEYQRWDLTVQQQIGWGIQLFANFNNLNNRHDEQYRGASGNTADPSYLEYYGFTMDVGIRFRL